jgi:hypothetical protein
MVKSQWSYRRSNHGGQPNKLSFMYKDDLRRPHHYKCNITRFNSSHNRDIMLHKDSITNQTDFSSGASPAEALDFIDGKEEKAKLMDIMLDTATNSNINAKKMDYVCMLLHCAVAHCDSDTIAKILHMGADIMMKDSKQSLPLEVAIAYRNSKFIICKLALLRKDTLTSNLGQNKFF